MNLETARYNMINTQLRSQQICLNILNPMAALAREDFVPQAFAKVAYSDIFIPLPHGQVMLPPYLIGKILQALDLRAHTDSVLEIGTGSGYLTALLALITKKVLSFEIFPSLSRQAKERLNALAIHNVSMVVGDGLQGCKDLAPFDVIVLSGSLGYLPKKLCEQVAIGGRIFSLIGRDPSLMAVLLRRVTKESWSKQILFESTVPRLLHAGDSEPFNF